MSESATTPFSNKAEILGELWMSYRLDPEFKDFIDYNDLGLPMAYALSENIVTATPLLEQYLEETWDLLLEGLGIEEDTGYESLDELFDNSNK